MLHRRRALLTSRHVTYFEVLVSNPFVVSDLRFEIRVPKKITIILKS